MRAPADRAPTAAGSGPFGEHLRVLRRIGRAVTRYGDPNLDVATIDRGHRQAMRELTRVVRDLGKTYDGPDHQVLFFALRTVAVEAEGARQMRAQLDRFPEWVWRRPLRKRVTRIAGCVTEAIRVIEGRPEIEAEINPRDRGGRG